MNILAIDTSTRTASVALCNGSEILSEFSINNKLTHSEHLMPMIKDLFKYLSLELKEVDLFAVTEGPGSFTGLRIGMTTVKALAYANGKPMIGVNTLETLAYNIHPILPCLREQGEPDKTMVDDLNHIPSNEPRGEGFHVCPILDARNDQVFTAIFSAIPDGYERVTDYMAVEIKELLRIVQALRKRTVFLGDAMSLHRTMIESELKELAEFAQFQNQNQRASTLAFIALKKFNNGEFADAFSAVPFYLRKSQAEQEFEKKRATGQR